MGLGSGCGYENIGDEGMGLGSGCGYEDMGDEGMGFWFWIQDTRGRGFGVGYRIRGDGVLGLELTNGNAAVIRSIRPDMIYSTGHE